MTFGGEAPYNQRRKDNSDRTDDNMEGMMILKAMLSLAFVLGLMFLTLWAVRYCQLHGAKIRFMRKLGEQQRLQVLEVRRLDARNTLVLFRKDKDEHLVLLGAEQNLLIETVPLKKAQK